MLFSRTQARYSEACARYSDRSLIQIFFQHTIVFLKLNREWFGCNFHGIVPCIIQGIELKQMMSPRIFSTTKNWKNIIKHFLKKGKIVNIHNPSNFHPYQHKTSDKYNHINILTYESLNIIKISTNVTYLSFKIQNIYVNHQRALNMKIAYQNACV